MRFVTAWVWKSTRFGYCGAESVAVFSAHWLQSAINMTTQMNIISGSSVRFVISSTMRVNQSCGSAWKTHKEGFDGLSIRGGVVARLALEDKKLHFEVLELHRSLGALVRMLRRRDGLSIGQLARDARVEPHEIIRIENDPFHETHPRTIVQISVYFGLPVRGIAVLAGAMYAGPTIRTAAGKFAAHSQGMAELTSEEHQMLTDFVDFLRAETDKE